VNVSVVIVGGGPAGVIAGLRLARAGVDVLIVDRVRATRPTAAEILSPEGRQILERERVWDTIPLGVTALCSEMAAAWEDPVPQWTSFMTHPYGPAWHIDRVRFDAWLTQAAVAAGARIVNGTVDAARDEGDRWDVEFAVGDARQSITARALILATGRSSWRNSVPRHPFGVRQRIDNFCLVSGTTAPDREHPDALIVEAVEDGWWYSAPLMGGRLFAGWMTDFSLVPGSRYVDAAAASLQRAPIHRRRLGDARLTTFIGAASWATLPCAASGWIAVGDAALARDPISGDGLTSALRSGCDAADVIEAALGGEALAWTRAAAQGAEVASRYQQQRLELYRKAQARWPASAFWRRFSA
jgi:flavin-dependent dehydrogenase